MLDTQRVLAEVGPENEYDFGRSLLMHSISMRCVTVLQSQIARTNDYAGCQAAVPRPEANHQHVVWLRTANSMQVREYKKMSVHSLQCSRCLYLFYICVTISWITYESGLHSLQDCDDKPSPSINVVVFILVSVPYPRPSLPIRIFFINTLNNQALTSCGLEECGQARSASVIVCRD